MPPTNPDAPSGSIPNTDPDNVTLAGSDQGDTEPSRGDPKHPDIDDLELNLNGGVGPNDSPAPADQDKPGEQPLGVDPHTGAIVGGDGADTVVRDNDDDDTDPATDAGERRAAGADEDEDEAVDPSKVASIRELGRSIFEAARAQVKKPLEADEIAIAERAALAIAVESTLAFGLSDADRAQSQVRLQRATSTLLQITVGASVSAQESGRNAIYSAVQTFFREGLGFLSSVILKATTGL